MDDPAELYARANPRGRWYDWPVAFLHLLWLLCVGIVRLVLFLVMVGAGLALFVGFWFGLNWLLHSLGIPIRIMPRW